MLSNLIGKKIEDIIISGYTENHHEHYSFYPMNWWVFLKIGNNKFIELFSNDGDILIKHVTQIPCEFDIEENDIFTLTSICQDNLGKIKDIFYKRDVDNNLIRIKIKTDNSNISFDSLDINGFKIFISHKT